MKPFVLFFASHYIRFKYRFLHQQLETGLQHYKSTKETHQE